jgi:ERCC4-related helicase
MSNQLLEQYGIHKLAELHQSPYNCLKDAKIEHTPYQMEAFLAALQALKTGGIILADEVGLGKTIETGLILKYLIKSGTKRIMIAMPPPLRKQWQDELKEKFDIEAHIPEGKHDMIDKNFSKWHDLLIKSDNAVVIITSYGLAPFIINNQFYRSVKWDYFVFDEAHRLRNLKNGAKMPEKLYNATYGIPKIMLTATPLQNNLRELYALSLYIDEKIFINEKIFNDQYVRHEDYDGLRKMLSPILHRTLRKDVAEYVPFSKRDSMTIDFKLSMEEMELYNLANDYLKRPVLYAVNANNNALVKMVIRKLLASSSFAVAETYRVLKERLKILKQDTKSQSSDVSLKAFFKLIDDDSEDATGEEIDDDLEKIKRKECRTEINDELIVVENIIKTAEKITKNSKSQAVKEALKLSFENKRKNKVPEKALIFTESKRTQKYLVESLKVAGFDGILVFNGEMSDPETKSLYKAWCARNPKRITNSLSVDMKQAIVEQFENEAKILIATDVASEGLNLQFCDTVINYDLPWNPMKIEQRIGRCHRFGQERDVWVYNLLNRENEADKRVYEILETKFNLFKGVFGASDEALGLLESGSDFEKKIEKIYEQCNTASDFNREFDRLEQEIAAKRNAKGRELKHILQTVSSDVKKRDLAKIARSIGDHFVKKEEWEKISGNTKKISNISLMIKNAKVNFTKKNIQHGYIFIGAMHKKSGEFIEPIMNVFEKYWNPVAVSEDEVINAFKDIPEEYFETFALDANEIVAVSKSTNKLESSFIQKYLEHNKVIIEEKNKRMDNWVENRQCQYEADSDGLRSKISELKIQKEYSKYHQEKMEIQKNIEKNQKELEKRIKAFPVEMTKVEQEAEEEKRAFAAQFRIEHEAIIHLVVKF